MHLDSDLQQILRCPKCKGSLKLQAEPGEDDEGGMECEVCSLRYPVVEGVVNFLVKDARPLGD